jgi:hypothetical protein
MVQRSGPSKWTDDQPTSVIVDGQEFIVRPRPAAPGTYDFDWTTGPNPNYGFSLAGSPGRPLTHGEIEDAIRNFLRQVDPETGYIED